MFQRTYFLIKNIMRHSCLSHANQGRDDSAIVFKCRSISEKKLCPDLDVKNVSADRVLTFSEFQTTGAAVE